MRSAAGSSGWCGVALVGGVGRPLRAEGADQASSTPVRRDHGPGLWVLTTAGLRCGPMADDFSTEVAEVGGATVIAVRGEIDMATCEQLRDAIEPHLGPAQTIVLDLSEVRFMDSTSFAVLVQDVDA